MHFLRQKKEYSVDWIWDVGLGSRSETLSASACPICAARRAKVEQQAQVRKTLLLQLPVGAPASPSAFHTVASLI